MSQIEYYSDVTLNGYQLKDFVIETVATEADKGTSVAGRLIYVDETKKLYRGDGTSWIEVAAGGDVSSLITRISDLETTVGKTSEEGLQKVVSNNTANISKNETAISGINEDLGTVPEGKTVVGMIGENTTAIEALQGTVGDSANGLVKDVAALKTTVGDASGGLVKSVTDNTAAIGTKVDKVGGKGLSTEDYTTAEKTKLNGIAEGAQVNVLEGVQVDGMDLAISGKKVNIDLTSYAKKTDVATAYKPKGSAATLPAATDYAVGDVLNLTATFTLDGKSYPAGTNVVCIDDAGTKKWDALAGFIDISVFALASDVTTGLNGKVDKTTTVNGKALDTNITIGITELQGQTGYTDSALSLPISTATQTALNGKADSATMTTELGKKVDKLESKPAAGTFTKVTINEEGQVTAGAALAAADVPDLTASKITDFASAAKTATRIKQTVTIATTGTDVAHNFGDYPSSVSVYYNNKLIFCEVAYKDTNTITLTANQQLSDCIVVISA